ncbi:FG-GAP-like repeat-containing protein [Luteibaculum oceani]|uniref:T9SS type A sorting domain-containing protein n=1 Tax=Luteibaculum oceani TaxID=1294296 RepID=A0A5C6VPI9_9FLAO|nr:FG-GAP-like repeat-containing protein [Luteibaculum oceani]TXC85138.1 T9SS type A sorting domain-containing protein [Luteibaculum oceani]
MKNRLQYGLLVVASFFIGQLYGTNFNPNPITISSGEFVRGESVTAADINNDGLEDLILQSNNQTIIKENLGQFNFQSHVIANTNVGMFSMASDIDLDGDLDIVVGSHGAPHKIEWLRNDGNWNFSKILIAEVQNIRSFDIKDVDFNGTPDIICGVGSSLGQVVLFSNNVPTNETFDQIVVGNIGTMSETAFAFDLDQDGDLDLIAGSSRSPYVFNWYEQTDSLIFQEHQISTTLGGIRAVDAADIDNDLDIDLVVASWDQNKIYLLKNNGNETFETITLSPNGVDMQAVHFVDIDLDDDLDIAWASHGSNIIGWLENTSTSATFTYISQELPQHYRTTWLDHADLDNDGDQDLFSIDHQANVGSLVVYENFAAPPCSINEIEFEIDSVTYAGLSASVYLKSTEVGVDYYLTDNPETLDRVGGKFGEGEGIVLTVDFLPAGQTEYFIVAVKNEFCEVVFDQTAVFFGNEYTLPTPIFSEITALSIPFNNVEAVYSADFNNDGLQDIYATGRDFVKLYINQGGLNFEQVIVFQGFYHGFDVKAIDIDKDGFLDIVGTELHSKSMHFFKNNGDLTFTKSLLIPEVRNVRYFEVEDMNGDGNLDVVLASREGHNDVRLYLNDGNLNFTETKLALNTELAHTVKVGDINGDGLKDIVWGNFSELNPKLEWLEQDQNGNYIPHQIQSTINGFISADIADPDNDGDMDIVLASVVGNSIFLYINDGNNNFSEKEFSLMERPESVEFVDLDLDGDLDISAVGWTGFVGWFENLGGKNFFEHPIVQSGTGDGPTWSSTSDLDNDGDLEIVVANYLIGVNIYDNTAITCQIEEVNVLAPEQAYFRTSTEVIIPLPQQDVTYFLIDPITSSSIEGTLNSNNEVVFTTPEMELGTNVFEIYAVHPNCEGTLQSQVIIEGIETPISFFFQDNYAANSEDFIVPVLINAHDSISGINGKFSYDVSAFSNVYLDTANAPEGHYCESNTDTINGTVNFVWQGADFVAGHGAEDTTVAFNFVFVPRDTVGIFDINLIDHAYHWTVSHVEGYAIPFTLYNGTVELARFFTLQSEFRTINGEMVPDVHFAFNGRGGFDTTFVDLAYYRNERLLPGDFTFNIAKDADNDPTNGINVVDITLLRRHMLQISELSGAQLVAADVNNDGNQNLSDVLSTKLIILEILNSFGGEAWRFAPWNHNLEDPNALGFEFTTYLQEDALLDFMAIKLGDIDGSWDGPLNSSKAPIAFDLILGEKNAEGHIPVYLPYGMNLTGIQFTLETTKGEINIINGAMNIQQGNTTEGVATGLWEDASAQGQVFSENEPIFYIMTEGEVNFSDRFTPCLVATDALEVSRFGGAATTSINENNGLNQCLDVFPVPATNHINVNLCNDVTVTGYQIITTDGKVISTKQVDSNSITIENADLPAPGVYQLIIQTTNGKAVKPIVIK